ncbi:XRE family transcriptional regulator [Pseudomonas sp. RIT-To-2]|uniref:XRE family transcriptional regulator n=1 Tax=Pseudomonas sp. RIT-To-2 TaxID=3462541 RepID=UPI0024131919
MTKKRILPPELMAECEAAHALFLSKKNDLKLSQKKIADEAGMTPAAVNLYFKGINPLNAKFAAVLARMLDEPIESFSRRLADEISSMTKAPVTKADQSQAPRSAADLVKEMLAKSGKGIPEETRERLLAAADDESPAGYLPSEHRSLRPRKEEIVIPQYDVRAAMGHGQVPAEYTEVVRNLVVREELLRDKGVTYTSASALAMIVGWGQSMEGTINDKDLVIVDRGVNEYVGDAIYVLTWHGHLFIKRIQILDADRFLLVSDNPKVRDVEARVEDVTIHAKALYIWNGRKA